MTSGDQTVGRTVPWNGSSPAVTDIRRALEPFAPEGTIRLALQRLALHELGRPVGDHEIIDAVTDVAGNLVAVPLRPQVRADHATAAALDTALARLRRDLSAAGADGVDSLEVILDADGQSQVRIAFGIEVAPAELEDHPLPSAVHDGAHHVTHHAPALDDLRDRLAGPEPGPIRQVLRALREALDGLRTRHEQQP